jgi:hypothetical protein
LYYAGKPEVVKRIFKRKWIRQFWYTKGNGKCEGRKYLTDIKPELFDLVVSYRKKIDRKTHQPFSYRKISALIQEEHNLSISFNSVKRILEDVVRIKREERNRKRRKLVA